MEFHCQPQTGGKCCGMAEEGFQSSRFDNS